ncbi:MAG: branched-chain amino acid ABC transporter permease [Rhodanobacteraceae bacterium]
MATESKHHNVDVFTQILISGFVLGAVYALSAAGMTIVFGVSGVLNLAHGGIVTIAAMVAWYIATHLNCGILVGGLSGVASAVVVSYLLYVLVIIPLGQSRHITKEELPVFQLVATLLVALILHGILGFFFGSTPVATPPVIHGVIHVSGNAVPKNNLFIGAVAWLVLVGLKLFISFTQLGKAMTAASMSPKGLAIVGYSMRRVYFVVWGLYGLLAGVAGVLLSSFMGASTGAALNLTAIAFIIVVLGGLGSVLGSLVGAYILGFLSTITAYLISPALSVLPGLFLLVVVLYVRPKGLFGTH